MPILLLASSALFPASALAQSASFEGLGTLGGCCSLLYGYGHSISGDGTVVVGQSLTPGNTRTHAFRWSGGVMTDLGTLGGNTSYGYAVSSDGSTVVGAARTATANHAFRWTAALGMVDLGVLPGGTYSIAYGVSANGSVIVGYGEVPGAEHAFRWSGVMTDLGTLGGTNSRAFGVSADGTVIIGSSQITGDTGDHAFRWVGGVMTDLGTLGGNVSAAQSVSADGNVVVGYSIDGSSRVHPFHWTAAAGMTDLGTLGGNQAQAYGVSGNGKVVVGYSNLAGDTTQAAFRWTAATNMQSVPTLLGNAGVNLGSWRLTEAVATSADGSVIVGNGTNPGGNNEAWIARLCDLPGTCVNGGSSGGSGGSGLITVGNQMQSFASVGAVGQTAGASLSTNFSTVTNYAMQSGAATAPGKTGSAFFAAGYDSDPTVSGTLGATRKINDSGLIVGATVGADYIKTNMTDKGSARMNAGTFGVFLAQAPEAGWQALLGVNAIYLNGKISRGYLNGASEVTSTGSTHGGGYGLAGRIGYTFANLSDKTSLTPFASYTYTRIDFAGYTETDGPFPAVMNSFHNIEQVSRLGADARYTLKPGTWLWGTLAWGHRLDAGRSADVSGTLIGLFPLSTSGGITTRRDWLEATGGVRLAAWKDGAITASLTAIVPENVPANFVVHLGISQAY